MIDKFNTYLESKFIGRVEKVDLPELNIFDIDAKIDTGAYTSTIHCHEISEDDDILTFILLDPSYPEYTGEEIKFDKFTKTKIKSSTGKSQNRYKIKTVIKIGGKKYKINFTLTDRSKMSNPILLGRKLFNKRFVVDVTHKYLLSEN